MNGLKNLGDVNHFSSHRNELIRKHLENINLWTLNQVQKYLKNTTVGITAVVGENTCTSDFTLDEMREPRQFKIQCVYTTCRQTGRLLYFEFYVLPENPTELVILISPLNRLQRMYMYAEVRDQTSMFSGKWENCVSHHCFLWVTPGDGLVISGVHIFIHERNNWTAKNLNIK